MNVVLKAFKDKTNDKVYFAGDAYDGERTEELIGLGYVQPKKKTRAKKTTE